MMHDDANVRILVEMVFAKKTELFYKSSIPNALMDEDFKRCIKEVLHIRRKVVYCRWGKFLDTCFTRMFSSQETYLTFVMFACSSELDCHQHIFDGFIDVCVLLLNLSDEIYEKLKVDFHLSNPDIMMAFYNLSIKEVFCRRGGFSRLVEYIRTHRILRKKGADDIQKLQQEIRKGKVVQNVTNPNEVANHYKSILLARLVMSVTLVKLPAIPPLPFLVERMVAYKRNEMLEGKGESEAARNFANLDGFDSKTKHLERRPENIERYENTIQAVMRHNHSENSRDVNPNNRIPKEADAVLEHLKDTIKSLVGVLDEYDKQCVF